ncbi:uncharacterized protein LOC130778989 isoform X2 [Actinidia eriantha]|uniref:uncharacterized protein LOC130778989 isoform X2 n=1 Tax=Actinidia eriantha TaxID=165200 RepID=UPI00258A08A8|nr:uncharacterized protein LOC130778989 isoform X2 [Actinidia eriantha]
MKLPLMSELNRKLEFKDPGCLGESSGKLHYFRVMGTVLCVWVANQKSSIRSVDWVHQHLMNLSNVMCEGPRIIRPCGSQAIAFLDGCDGALVGLEGKVIAYLLNGGRVREVCKVRRNGCASGYLRPRKLDLHKGEELTWAKITRSKAISSHFAHFADTTAITGLPSNEHDRI